VGSQTKQDQAPAGATENTARKKSFAPAGAFALASFSHAGAVGYYLSRFQRFCYDAKMMSAGKLDGAVSQLCPNCGLCCNGVLFADVELRAGDDATRLMELGLSLHKKGRNKTAFAQPCACFDGKLCVIYADRPKRCRTFECGLLKKVAADELSTGAALKKISSAKILAETVRGRLRSLGRHDERLALTKRYAQVMGAPVDLAAAADESELRGELMLAVNELMQMLQRDFLK
jgi:hypothetical protein